MRSMRRCGGWVLGLAACGFSPPLAESGTSGDASTGSAAGSATGTGATASSTTAPGTTGSETGTTDGDPTGTSGPSSTTGTGTSSGSGESSGTETEGPGSGWQPTCPGDFGPWGCESPDHGDACNAYTQDCPGGSKCGFNEGEMYEWFNLEETCLPIVGAQTVGQPCSYADGFYEGADDCDANSWCNNVDYDTMIGECVEFCRCDEFCGTEGSWCQQTGYAPYCGYLCNPLLDDDACPAGWHCLPEAGSQTPWSTGFFTCKPQYATPSEGGNLCPNGFTVLDEGGCVELCSPDGEFPCDDGGPCTELEPVNTCPASVGYCE
jgi:hypothetical protein